MKSFHRRTARPAPQPASHDAAPVARHGLTRIDSMLVSRGLAPSRTAAQRMIAAGRICADGRPVTKASLEVAECTELDVSPDEDDRFVSRGGLKLAGALAHTGLDVTGMRCLDVGQSTGGFSDCLLQAGAAAVVGIEVGHDQLHPRLRRELRIHCLEGVNARSLSPGDLGVLMPPDGFDLVTCDASFISLTLLMPRWPCLLGPSGHVLALVKPQFEVGPRGLGKGGIVRDERLFESVRTSLCTAAGSAGLDVMDYFDSPITGGDGNREFFIFAARKAG